MTVLSLYIGNHHPWKDALYIDTASKAALTGNWLRSGISDIFHKLYKKKLLNHALI